MVKTEFHMKDQHRQAWVSAATILHTSGAASVDAIKQLIRAQTPPIMTEEELDQLVSGVRAATRGPKK